MGNKQSTVYGNQFKAKIALKALKGASPEDLSKKYDIALSDIEKWVVQLEERAQHLFMDEAPCGSYNKDIKDYAALLRTTIEATPNGILVADLDMNLIAYNQYGLKMWGIPEKIAEEGELSEVMKYALPQMKNPEGFKNKVKKLYEKPIKENRDIIEFKDGRIFQRHSVPFVQEEEVMGRVTSFTDITEFKKAQEQIERYSKLLDSIATNVNEGILRSTPSKGLLYANDAFASMFGYESTEEVIQASPETFYADPDQRWQLVKKLKKNGQLVNEEVLFKRKDGSTFYALENSTLVEEDDQIYIDAVINDINERKRTKEALRVSERKYRNILDSIEDGYFETDLSGNFTFVNPAMQKMLGYTHKELIGMNNREYMDAENANSVYSTFNEVYKTGESKKAFDWQLIRKNGEPIIVEASFNLKINSEGEQDGFRGIVRDITDRKEKEKKIKNSLKEKEVLLGEIHHRVKNNLAVISGLLFLQAEKTEDETGRNLLQQSQGRINSMAIVHELLYENHNFSSIDPDKYIKQLVVHISSNLSVRDKEISTNISTDGLQLDMNIAIPCALIINELLTNAYKYAFEGREEGTIDVSIVREGNNHILTVADDGTGLPEDFDPKGSDIGLGLFLVQTLAQQIQGELAFSDENGTEVVITFPIDQD